MERLVGGHKCLSSCFIDIIDTAFGNCVCVDERSVSRGLACFIYARTINARCRILCIT